MQQYSLQITSILSLINAIQSNIERNRTPHITCRAYLSFSFRVSSFLNVFSLTELFPPPFYTNEPSRTFKTFLPLKYVHTHSHFSSEIPENFTELRCELKPWEVRTINEVTRESTMQLGTLSSVFAMTAACKN